jgi:hypothetical protein
MSYYRYLTVSQIVLYVFDLRGDDLPHGVELYSYGFPFVQPTTSQANAWRRQMQANTRVAEYVAHLRKGKQVAANVM